MSQESQSPTIRFFLTFQCYFKNKSLTDPSKLPKTYLLPIYCHDLYLSDQVTTHRWSIFLLKHIPSNCYSVHQVKLEIRQYPAWGTSTLIVLDKADSVNGYYVHWRSPSEFFFPGSLRVHNIFCPTLPPGFYCLYNDVKVPGYFFYYWQQKNEDKWLKSVNTMRSLGGWQQLSPLLQKFPKKKRKQNQNIMYLTLLCTRGPSDYDNVDLN